MRYRRLGRAGLQLSEPSLGSWIIYHNQVGPQAAVEMMAAAYDAGVNFFDNAEVYAGGRSEEVMGEALRRLGWPRLNYVVSTKFFWGLDRSGEGINRRDTLNRKYLMQAIDGSLRRAGLEQIDLVYCHRPDPHTPIEETVRAMSDMITQGKALYWGTSEWSAAGIRAAWEIAEKLCATTTRLAIAWVTKNRRVSSVITGASRVGQLRSNLGALEVADRLTPELMNRIELATAPLAD